MGEESIRIIKVETIEAFQEIGARKAVILDVRWFKEQLGEIEKSEILLKLQQTENIVVLVCRLEERFFSVDCKPYVDMMYLAVSEEVTTHPAVMTSVNGIVEGEDLAAVKERLQELTDGREPEHLKQIKTLFSKLRNQTEYTRQDLKMEESCLFCKLACEKEVVEDESGL